MKTKVVPFAAVLGCFFVCCLAITPRVQAQSNLALRVMAANTTSGNGQSYLDPGIRIFQGLKPDVVCIQEFNYGTDSDNDIRTFVDTAFGASFHYTRETNGSYDIPNGVISRWPIIAAGTWDDSSSPNRGFAWAQIDLPGTNDLYVVSVHLLTANSSTRATEAAQLKTLIQSEFPTGAWVVVGGDMNTDSRSESAIDTFKTFLSDSPVPSDDAPTEKEGTNASREKPYDYLLPSFSLTNYLTAMVVGSRTFPKGLVFDSRVYSPLGDVAPVLVGDSGAQNMQHMAVIKDFLIPIGGATTNPPSITTQPQSQTNNNGANVTFNVVATGATPLAFQWRFLGTNLSGATTNSYSITSIQATNAGNYTVVVTNSVGSITSEVATLTITTGPNITNQPQSLTVFVGQDATFTVGVSGAGPLSYQWRFATTNISGATNNAYTRTNAQPADAGNYTVVVTNSSGSITSGLAVLTVNTPGTGSIIVQWDFNSVPPNGSVTNGTTAPSIGTGTASLVTALTPTFAGGSATDPASAGTDNSGWNTTGYPAATSGNRTAGVRFDVSTLGKQNLTVRWDQRVSNTGSKYSRLQYTTNGTTFLDFPTSVAVGSATFFEAHTNNLGALPGVNNNASFGFRIVNEFENTATGAGTAAYAAAATTYAGSGTTRFDMVTLLGDSIPASNPAIAPTLTNAAFAGSQFQFLLTGTTGSNYIVQAATNLSTANWIPVQTNAAPFTFVETNVFALPQRFYRGTVAP